MFTFKGFVIINDQRGVLENNWYSLHALAAGYSKEFVEGSFFKTLSKVYLIEITGSEQEIRAVKATEEVANNLGNSFGRSYPSNHNTFSNQSIRIKFIQ